MTMIHELTPQITKDRGAAFFKPQIVLRRIANIITASFHASI